MKLITCGIKLHIFKNYFIPTVEMYMVDMIIAKYQYKKTFFFFLCL